MKIRLTIVLMLVGFITQCRTVAEQGFEPKSENSRPFLANCQLVNTNDALKQAITQHDKPEHIARIDKFSADKVFISMVKADDEPVKTYSFPFTIGSTPAEPCDVKDPCTLAAINLGIRQSHENREDLTNEIAQIGEESYFIAPSFYELQLSFISKGGTERYRMSLEGVGDQATCRDIALTDWELSP